MGFGLSLVLIVLIICISISVWIYMYYCGESEIKMFADPRYEERLSRLEKLLETEEEKK